MEELYDLLLAEGDYTGTFQEFEDDWGEDNYKSLYNELVSNEDYIGDFDNFLQDYTPPETDGLIEAYTQDDLSDTQEIPEKVYERIEKDKDGNESIFIVEKGKKQQLTDLGKKDLEENYITAIEGWDKLTADEPIDDKDSIDSFKDKAIYIQDDLIKNNKYLNFKNKKILNKVDQFFESKGSVRDQIIEKYNLNDPNVSAETLEEANQDYSDQRADAAELMAENDSSYQAILKAINNKVTNSIGSELAQIQRKKDRSEVEFKIPFTDILLPKIGSVDFGKGISDNVIVEGLQQFGKGVIQSLYGIELMGPDKAFGRTTRATKAINSLEKQLEEGEIKLNDKTPVEIKKMMQGYIKDPNITVGKTIKLLNDAIGERKEEQFETITDIQDINKDLQLFTENKIWEDDGGVDITLDEIGGIVGEQVPQIGLALVFGGVGVMAQEIGGNYITNLNAITRQKFKIPENEEPTPEQLMSVINSGEDEAGVAIATGAVAGYLEKISAGKLLKVNLKKPIGSIVRGEFKIAAQSLLNSGKAVTEASLLEALTEGLQGGLSQLGESVVTDENRFDLKELREQASQGALVGGGISSLKVGVTQTAVETKQAAMKIAGALGSEGKLGQLEKSFKLLETKIKTDGRLNPETVNNRLKSLGQVRNALNSIPKDYTVEQREKALQLLIKKEDLNRQFENVDQSMVPQSIKDQFESINKQLGQIAEDAYITRTVDMAQKEGIGENVLVAKTSKQADKLAAENDMVMQDKKGQRSEGVTSPDNKTIIIDLEQAKKVKAFNVAGHELLHRILFNTLYKKNKEGKLEGTNVARSLGIELDKQLNKIDPSILKNEYLKQRFKSYKDQGKTMQAEEKLTILSDALRLGAISLNENAIQRFNTFFRRLFQNLGWKKIKFKDGKDVINFISDYNASLDKGQLGKAIKEGAVEGFEVIRGKDGIKKLKDDTSFTQKQSVSSADIDALVGPKTDGKYTLTKSEWDGGKADQAIVNSYERLQGLIKSKIPREKPPGFSQEDFVSGTIAELIPHIRNFNPEQNNSLSGWINSQLQNKIGNVFKKGEAATKDVFEADVDEARGVAVEEAPTPIQEKSIRSKLRRDLKIDKPLIDKVKQTVRKTFGTKLPEIESKEFKQALQKAYRTELKTPLAELLGTRENYKKFLEDNFESIYKALPQDILNKRFRQFAEDTGQREKTPEGKKIFKKRSIDKQEFVDYFLGPKVGTSTKGTRKDALAETLGEIMALDATMEVIKEPEVKTKREAITKLQNKKVTKTDEAKIGKQIDRDPSLKFSISEGTQDILNNANFDLDVKGVDALLNNYSLNPVSTITINELNNKSKAQVKSWIDNQIKYMFPTMPRIAFFGPSGGTAYTGSSKILGTKFGSLKDKNGKTIYDKIDGKRVARKNPVWEYFVNQVKSLNDPKSPNYLPDSAFGKPIISKKADVELFKIKSYKTLFNTPSNIRKNILNGEIKKFNTKVSLIHKVLWERLDKSIRDTKNKSAPAIATYLRITANDTKHWHKQGANFVGYSIKPKGTTNKEGKTTLYEYEHAMPATASYMYLLDVSLRRDNFKPAYDAVMDNYKLIALDKAENAKLGKAKLGRGMPKGWQLGENFWWQRYFNAEVAKIDGGIPPSSIINVNGKTFAEEFKIDVAGQPTTIAIENSKITASKFNNKSLPLVVRLKGDYTNQMVLDEMAELDKEQLIDQMKFSKSIDLNKDFNDIIENKTGIGSEKIYSDVKAQVVGANKGKFNFFVPPSAEDFVGLLYKTLGKGKLGDAQMAWYKKHLLDPFARAMDNISRDRIALMNDFKALKKDLKIVPKNLKKKLPGEPFTQEQAVRTYIWNKQGMTPEGMSKKDIKELTDFVESKPELVIFADQLIALQKGDKYPAPKFGWLAGNITTDLMDGINTIKRAKYLEQWQYNVDQIFTKPNLNKLEAAYGKDYRTALENILKRMRTGRNREFTSDSLTGRVTDWLTNSIGAIMFFNTRSAVLQTISAVNFINFKDNNLFAAGKAFANQPQFWKDFKTLFNSDFLVDRRNGLRLNVNEADIADMAKKGGVRGVISELLRIGFLPTQIADSFAIASGGSTFYRNRVKKYTKEGMSKAEAENQAFIDFREIAEEAQQSSRPDRISMQQAGPLGRVILAFANTPMQYTRLIKKAASDLKNGRGDTTTNISKILYYGFVQNLFFNAMQQALFAMGFGDEEEETEKREEKYANIVNSMADSILRGAGVGGAIFSVLKNTAIKLNREAQKKSPKFQDVLTKEIAQLSPPVSSKLSKLRAAGRAYSWNKKEIMEKGFSLDNPAYLAAGQVIAATTNVPLDRAFKKIDNIRKASSSDYEAWARIAMLAGWSDWELGVKKEKPKIKSVKKKKTKKKPKKRF